jgi:hypothetical protein
MVSAKYLAFLFLAGIAAAEDSVVVSISTVEEHARQAEPAAPVAPAVPGLPVMGNEHWTMQVRDAVNGASDRLSQNMVVVLSSLAETMRNAGLNNTRAFASLTRAIVTNVVDLTGVVAYMPRLFLLDLPNQFTEVLRLIRRNEVRYPSSVNEAIDSILVLTRQAEESGITQRVYGPIIKFMPNILNGAHDFLQVIFTTMFNVFGANVPDPVYSPIPARGEDEFNVTAPIPTSSVSPSARYYHY